MLTIVSAPADLIVAVSDGIAVRFAGVEVGAEILQPSTVPAGDKGVRVLLEGVRGLETSRRDLHFLLARDRWAERVRTAGKERAGDPPVMPGVPVLNRVQVLVGDDAGTPYRRTGGQVAGDDTEWSAAWVYWPEPPPSARTLDLHVTLDGEPTPSHIRLCRPHPG